MVDHFVLLIPSVDFFYKLTVVIMDLRSFQKLRTSFALFWRLSFEYFTWWTVKFYCLAKYCFLLLVDCSRSCIDWSCLGLISEKSVNIFRLFVFFYFHYWLVSILKIWFTTVTVVYVYFFVKIHLIFFVFIIKFWHFHFEC